MKNAQYDISHMIGVSAVNKALINSPMVVTVLPPKRSARKPAGMVLAKEPQKNPPFNKPLPGPLPQSYCGPYCLSSSIEQKIKRVSNNVFSFEYMSFR